MKALKDILSNVTILSTNGSTDRNINAIVFDSRKAVDETIFVAIKGTVVDGHDYISSVIENGCKVIVAEKSVDVPANVTLVITDNSHKALAATRRCRDAS